MRFSAPNGSCFCHTPANGDQVLVRARISFYEPRGEFQLIIEHSRAAGAGSAQREFEALKQNRRPKACSMPHARSPAGVPAATGCHHLTFRRRDPRRVESAAPPLTPAAGDDFSRPGAGKGAADELLKALDLRCSAPTVTCCC